MWLAMTKAQAHEEDKGIKEEEVLIQQSQRVKKMWRKAIQSQKWFNLNPKYVLHLPNASREEWVLEVQQVSIGIEGIID